MFFPTELLVLALAVLSTSALPTEYPEPAPAPVPEFVCPSEDISATKCMGPKDCLYPDPTNCNGFIQCAPADDTYTTGTVYHMPCPDGLLWNDVQKWCDWPENTTCAPVM